MKLWKGKKVDEPCNLLIQGSRRKLWLWCVQWHKRYIEMCYILYLILTKRIRPNGECIFHRCEKCILLGLGIMKMTGGTLNFFLWNWKTNSHQRHSQVSAHTNTQESFNFVLTSFALVAYLNYVSHFSYRDFWPAGNSISLWAQQLFIKPRQVIKWERIPAKVSFLALSSRKRNKICDMHNVWATTALIQSWCDVRFSGASLMPDRQTFILLGH